MMDRKVSPVPFDGTAFDVVAIAASAGGLTAIRKVLSPLPADFPAAVLIVQHMDPSHDSLMAEILSSYALMNVKQAEEGDILRPSTVYTAIPDRHLMVNSDGTISLSSSEPVNFVRPSADRLFESVAGSYKDRAIAVVLTGAGKDGTIGVQAIKNMSGTVIVQDEATSEFFGMPGSVIKTENADFILSIDEVPPALVSLVNGGYKT
jgi:two-component system, chemotaxis family, protein-glutamate methylesterase/glutaminase